jgi:hypothetical protein
MQCEEGTNIIDLDRECHFVSVIGANRSTEKEEINVNMLRR